MNLKKIGKTAANAARKRRTWLGLALLAGIIGGPAVGLSVNRIGQAVTLVLGSDAPEPADINAAE